MNAQERQQFIDEQKKQLRELIERAERKRRIHDAEDQEMRERLLRHLGFRRVL